MIFVSVGNATQAFGRLLQAVDRLADAGSFGAEEVFIQAGHNPQFKSVRCALQPFIALVEFQRRLTEASLVICHGGCTVFQVLRAGKVPVVMPRMREYGEHVNDHQVEFTRALARDGWIIPAYGPEDLAPAIQKARAQPPKTWPVGQLHQWIERDIAEYFA